MKRLLLWIVVGIALLILPEWPCEYGEKFNEEEGACKRKS